MKLALAVLAAVLLTAGCGQSNTQKDPFVGTWHVASYGPGSGMAISKVSGAYRVTLVAHFKPESGYSWLCARRGSNELIVGPGQTEYVEAIKFNPASGRLTWTSNGMDPEEYSKVSDSTPPPSPWPTKSP